jgi:hypothetical protein
MGYPDRMLQRKGQLWWTRPALEKPSFSLLEAVSDLPRRSAK